MQSGCSQRLPLQSYLYRVFREDSLLIIVTLIQANAVTISKVYGGDYFYFSLPRRLSWLTMWSPLSKPHSLFYFFEGLSGDNRGSLSAISQNIGYILGFSS